MARGENPGFWKLVDGLCMSIEVSPTRHLLQLTQHSQCFPGTVNPISGIVYNEGVLAHVVGNLGFAAKTRFLKLA